MKRVSGGTVLSLPTFRIIESPRLIFRSAARAWLTATVLPPSGARAALGYAFQNRSSTPTTATFGEMPPPSALITLPRIISRGATLDSCIAAFFATLSARSLPNGTGAETECVIAPSLETALSRRLPRIESPITSAPTSTVPATAVPATAAAAVLQ